MRDVSLANPPMRFVRAIFALAAIYGIPILALSFFTLDRINKQYPPVVTHVEYYYSFVAIALVFQVVFVLIAIDPNRYQPLMLVGVLEKLSFFIPSLVLYTRGQLPDATFTFACIDGSLGAMFLIAWVVTRAFAPGRDNQNSIRFES